MTNIEKIETRYMQDELPIRLGNLASNLARIASVSKNPDNWKVIDSLMEESKFFIEWNIKDSDYEQLILLSKIQRQLAFWHCLWEQIHTNEIKCETIRNYTQKWSKELLEIAGLV